MQARRKQKTVLTILLCCILVLSLMPAMAFAEDTSESGISELGFEGKGTENVPYEIGTADDLVKLAGFVNESRDIGSKAENCEGIYFRQMDNIDLKDRTWEPIGYSRNNNYFSGNYDGGGHTISNAVSTGKNDNDGYAAAGIFGCVTNGSVSNLKVKNANFKAGEGNNYGYIGGIAGYVIKSSITNCLVSESNLAGKSTEAGSSAGSIAGFSEIGQFEKCASVGNTVQGQSRSGGFIGQVEAIDSSQVSDIRNCYVAECTVESSGNLLPSSGGFAGELTNEAVLNLTNSFIFGTKISNEQSGSTGILAGSSSNNYSFNINNCYYGGCSGVDGDDRLIEKSKEEFANHTVKNLLNNGNQDQPYIQGIKYPIFEGFGEKQAESSEPSQPTVPVITQPADYSKVDAAIAKANALNKSDYKDFSAVDAAVNAVVRGKDASRQAEVDAMAKAIEDALNGLEKKTSSDPQKTPGSAKDTISGNNAGLLNLKAKAGKNKVKIIWAKVPGASKYVVYGTKCNAGSKHYKFKKLKTTKKLSYTQKKLKKGTYYKYFVYAVNAKGKKIAASKMVHAVTAGGRYGNPKAVKVQNAAKLKTLKIGKRVRIKAVQIDSKKKTQKHCGLRYDSSNKAVVTVNSKGVISAKKKGKADVYVYAQNGVSKKITVTVK